MSVVYYDLEDPTTRMNYRWVQPPQIAYFVSTLDKNGNTNVTPVTMGTTVGGYYFAFTFSNLFVPDWDTDGEKPNVKHGYYNLKQIPECVISYIPHALVRESWITGMPVPRGISELDVAGLTPLPSRKVRPTGVKECPINLEARVLSSQKLPDKWTLYVCKIVAATVDAAYVENDAEKWDSLGVMAIDPVFEVKTGKGRGAGEGNVRLVYDRLDVSKIERCPEDVGCVDYWIGSFEQWMADEQGRGKLSEAEKQHIFDLNRRWLANQDPVANAQVKQDLTAALRKVVQPQTRH
jgi:flavin reductase (DIM6/NTAB) family NADH-FMN oxidoreductase RutF